MFTKETRNHTQSWRLTSTVLLLLQCFNQIFPVKFLMQSSLGCLACQNYNLFFPPKQFKTESIKNFKTFLKGPGVTGELHIAVKERPGIYFLFCQYTVNEIKLVA